MLATAHLSVLATAASVSTPRRAVRAVLADLLRRLDQGGLPPGFSSPATGVGASTTLLVSDTLTVQLHHYRPGYRSPVRSAPAWTLVGVVCGQLEHTVLRETSFGLQPGQGGALHAGAILELDEHACYTAHAASDRPVLCLVAYGGRVNTEPSLINVPARSLRQQSA